MPLPPNPNPIPNPTPSPNPNPNPTPCPPDITSTSNTKIDPQITENPSTSPIILGNRLSTSILSNGSATYNKVDVPGTNEVDVPGTFAFATPYVIPDMGESLQCVRFTPTDTTIYNSVTFQIKVTTIPNGST